VRPERLVTAFGDLMKTTTEALAREQARIADVYRRREVEIDKVRYAPWQPAANMMAAERKRVAAEMLHDLGKFPQRGDRSLEIGCGRLGWLADLLSWGLMETDLHGIDLDTDRMQTARQTFPNADLRAGDAAELPWPDESFEFVVLSTVFSSILDEDVRKDVADESTRVLSRGGAVVWYDLAVDNPKNHDVRGINAKELRYLFPGLRAVSRSVTLAPPLARKVAGGSMLLATALTAFPFLRTHILAILTKE